MTMDYSPWVEREICRKTKRSKTSKTGLTGKAMPTRLHILVQLYMQLHVVLPLSLFLAVVALSLTVPLLTPSLLMTVHSKTESI